jgi:integrase
MMICFESAVKKAEMTDFHFHDLRHTFTTRLRAAGTHEMDIMTLLGHSTLKMTPGYSHAVPQKLRTAIDSLAQGRVLSFAPSSREAED